MKVRVAIYVRVSTQEQAKEGYSIGEQTERLKKFAEANDWLIIRVYTDAGYSGADTNRPALQEMLEDIRSGMIDKVLVFKLDRLSRSQKDTLMLIENEFLPHGADFESMSERLDTSTAQGRLFLGILAAFAQLEREMIKERMSLGLEARLKEGKWRGTSAPFGYRYENDTLIQDDYEAMIVKHLFDDYTSGKSLKSISDDMESKGYLLRNQKADRKALKYILRNKTYCGYLRHKDDWIKGLHRPIIDEETFLKAQKRLDYERERFYAIGVKNGAHNQSTNLGGIIYCAQCGARYGKSASGNKESGIRMKYKCRSREKKAKPMIKDPNCKNKIYDIAELDNIVFNEIRKLKLDPNYINQIKNKSEDTAEKQSLIEKQIKSLTSQISRFMDLYGLGTFDAQELNDKITPLREQKEKLVTELRSLKDNHKITDKEVNQLVDSFEDALKYGTLDERRSIIQALINRIDIDGDDITIHWNFV